MNKTSSFVYAALCAISLAACGADVTTWGNTSGGVTSCKLDADCTAGRLCNEGRCTPSCNTDADCKSFGLSDKYACYITQNRCLPKCSTNADCPNPIPVCTDTTYGRFCFGGGTGTCSDNTKNGAETDVDCGGGSCGKCANGRGCQTGSDCVSGVCNASDHLCGIPDGGACSTADVCRSGICTGGYCQANSNGCGSGQTMCGGSCYDLQTNASHCGNCSTVCSGGQICSAGTCTTQGGGGGGPGTACKGDSDCLTGIYCVSNICIAPLCVVNVNPSDYICWGTNGAGDNRGNPLSRQVAVVDSGQSKVLTMYCCSGNDIGSVSTSGPYAGCRGIGEGGSNTTIDCHPLRPLGRGYGNGVQR